MTWSFHIWFTAKSTVRVQSDILSVTLIISPGTYAPSYSETVRESLGGQDGGEMFDNRRNI